MYFLIKIEKIIEINTRTKNNFVKYKFSIIYPLEIYN